MPTIRSFRRLLIAATALGSAVLVSTPAVALADDGVDVTVEIAPPAANEIEAPVVIDINGTAPSTDLQFAFSGAVTCDDGAHPITVVVYSDAMSGYGAVMVGSPLPTCTLAIAPPLPPRGHHWENQTEPTVITDTFHVSIDLVAGEEPEPTPTPTPTQTPGETTSPSPSVPATPGPDETSGPQPTATPLPGASDAPAVPIASPAPTTPMSHAAVAPATDAPTTNRPTALPSTGVPALGALVGSAALAIVSGALLARRRSRSRA